MTKHATARPNRAIRRPLKQPTASVQDFGIQMQAANDCPACEGRGHVRWVYPSAKPQPAYWFEKPCSVCDRCGGTGEAGP